MEVTSTAGMKFHPKQDQPCPWDYQVETICFLLSHVLLAAIPGAPRYIYILHLSTSLVALHHKLEEPIEETRD